MRAGEAMLDRRVVTFMQVAESGSFAKAAGALFMSTVSVKKQMDSLESLVGARLFDRTSRGVELTAAGEALLEGARKLAFFSERTLAQTRSAGQAQKQTIRVGTSFLRPCKRLIDLWSQIEGEGLPFHIEIVPFDDDTASVNEMIGSLGKRIDCFVAPCDSDYWRQSCNILVIEMLPFCLAVPKRHPLASKSLLAWDDLEGETLMLVPGNDSPIVGGLRAEIKERHPSIQIVNCPVHFDIGVFNKCEQSGYLLQSYPVWADAHPSLVTIPVAWERRMPYGIVYSGKPTEAVEDFIAAIRERMAGGQGG